MLTDQKTRDIFADLLKLALGTLVVLAAALLMGSGQVYAQSNEEPQDASDPSPVSGFIPEEYHFIVENGDNQTLLVRRSIQLFDMANDSLELSEAQMIYVETNVVQEMGARGLIYPQQMLDVMTALIAQYADASQALGQDTLAAWQVYADNADFDIDDISPSNVAVDMAGRVVESGDSSEDLAFTPEEPATDTSENESSSWSAWLAVAGAAAIVWYGFLRFREHEAK